MDEAQVMERLARAEERGKSNTHRIEKLEDLADGIHKQNETLVKLCGELERTNDNVERAVKTGEENSKRIADIEKQPLTIVQKVKVAIITAIASAVVTYALTWLISRI